MDVCRCIARCSIFIVYMFKLVIIIILILFILDRAVLVDYDFSELGYDTWDLAAFIEFSAVGKSK
jgi:hypothetical protein